MEGVFAHSARHTWSHPVGHAARSLGLTPGHQRANTSRLSQCFSVLTVGLALQAAQGVRAQPYTIGDVQPHAPLTSDGTGVHVSVSPGYGYVVAHKPTSNECDILGLHPNGSFRAQTASARGCRSATRPVAACGVDCGFTYRATSGVDPSQLVDFRPLVDLGDEVLLGGDETVTANVDQGSEVSHVANDIHRVVGWSYGGESHVSLWRFGGTGWGSPIATPVPSGFESTAAPPIAVVGNMTLLVALDVHIDIEALIGSSGSFDHVARLAAFNGNLQARAAIACSQPPAPLCGVIWAEQPISGVWESHVGVYFPDTEQVGPSAKLPISASENLPHHALFVTPPYVAFFVQGDQQGVTSIRGCALESSGGPPVCDGGFEVIRGSGAFGPIGAAAFNGTHGLVGWNEGRAVLVLNPPGAPTFTPSPVPTAAPADVPSPSPSLSVAPSAAPADRSSLPPQSLQSAPTSPFSSGTAQATSEGLGTMTSAARESIGPAMGDPPSEGALAGVVAGGVAAACAALALVGAYFGYRRRSRMTKPEPPVRAQASPPVQRDEEYDRIPPWTGDKGGAPTYGQAPERPYDDIDEFARAGSGYRRTPLENEYGELELRPQP